MPYYKDLREYLKVLEDRDKLIRIKREINKDTELLPLVRLQFRGLPEEERKAFIFENVVGSRGEKYSIPVVVGALAASKEIYCIGMGCQADELQDRWASAQLNPIEPIITNDGSVHEEIHMGNKLLEHGGFEEFPIPISTPGYDIGPYITSPYWITKDPETGVTNIGTYRVHVKSTTRAGMMVSTKEKHIAQHIAKCRRRGVPLQAAIVVGASPNIGYVSVNRLPNDVNEYAYSGAIAGAPVELVKCKTIDIEVPAQAEIVFEGKLSTTEVEPEAPFGEALGYMAQRTMMPYFTLTCVTHRRNPIWQSFISQFPPSESSVLRRIGREGRFFKYLRYDCRQSSVIEVAAHESTAAIGLIAVKLKKPEQSDVWQILEALSKLSDGISPLTKMIVAVDEDIDIRDADALNWAFSFRVQPHRDCRIYKYPGRNLMDFSLLPPGEAQKRDIRYQKMPEASRLLVNATLKWPCPPISLPKKEFMEKALKIWEEEKLPPLKLKQPWWGYSLGYWPSEEDEQAMMAVKGEYKRVGEMLAQGRKVIPSIDGGDT